MEPIDLFFIGIDKPVTSQKIACVLILDGHIKAEAIKQRVLEVSRLMPRLRLRFAKSLDRRTLGIRTLGRRNRWEVDPSYDVDSHYYSHELESDELPLDFISQLFCSPFPETRPPWSVHVMHQLSAKPASLWDELAGDLTSSQSGNSLTYIYYELHHALGDGVGGIEFMHRLLDSVDRSDSHRQFGHLPGIPSPKHSPWHQARIVSSEFFKKRGESPLNGKNSVDRKFLTTTLDMDEVRRVRRAIGTGFNDTLLCVIALACSFYHSSHASPLSCLKVIIPVNLRRERERLALGNRLTGASFSMHLKPNAFEQIRAISDTARQMKEAGAYAAFASMSQLISYLPSFLQGLVYREQARRTNFICTNVPGPLGAQTLEGIPLKAVYVFPALMPGHGIAIGLYTYNGIVHLSLTYDPKIVGDPELLMACIRNAWRIMLQATETK